MFPPVYALLERARQLHFSIYRIRLIWNSSTLHQTLTLDLNFPSWFKPKPILWLIKGKIALWMQNYWTAHTAKQHRPLNVESVCSGHEVIWTVYCTVSFSDLVWEELPVRRLCRGPEASWETVAFWVKTFYFVAQIHSFLPVLRKQADIMGHEGVGSGTLTHAWRGSIGFFFSIVREFPFHYYLSPVLSSTVYVCHPNNSFVCIYSLLCSKNKQLFSCRCTSLCTLKTSKKNAGYLIQSCTYCSSSDCF